MPGCWGSNKPGGQSHVPSSDGKQRKTSGEPRRIEDFYPLVSDADRQKSVKLLQPVVVDLLSLFEDCRRMHRNLSGPLYLQLHDYHQDWADHRRIYADVFAERTLQLGYSVDGHHSTVAGTDNISEPPAGCVTDSDKLLIDRVTIFRKKSIWA